MLYYNIVLTHRPYMIYRKAEYHENKDRIKHEIADIYHAHNGTAGYRTVHVVVKYNCTLFPKSWFTLTSYKGRLIIIIKMRTYVVVMYVCKFFNCSIEFFLCIRVMQIDKLILQSIYVTLYIDELSNGQLTLFILIVSQNFIKLRKIHLDLMIGKFNNFK